MSHISKNKLEPKLFNLIFTELSSLVAQSNRRSSSKLLRSLLTETEQIMLAKRLAIIVMLFQNKGVFQIAHRLHMSTSTVRRIADAYEEGVYADITRTLAQNKEKNERFWELIDIISRGGMPSRGKDRWQFLNKT